MRPPPLQLKTDNRFPELRPVREENKTSYWETLYRWNWRNVVLIVSVINILRFTLSAVNAYHDVETDNSFNFPHLAGISSFLCSMYLITSLIDIFGLLSLSMCRVIFVRVYVWLAMFSALVDIIAGAVTGSTFYILGVDVIQECVKLAMANELSRKSIFRGQPWPVVEHSLGSRQASQACQAAWKSEGPSQIISIFIFCLLPSLIYCFLVCTYYRQVIDPTHPAYLCETQPYSAIRMDVWPSESPIYNSNPVPTVVQNGKSQGGKKRAPKQPPLMTSSSPMEYLMTPGPPSFGPSRVQGYEPYSETSNVGYWINKRH
ncbi:hypothetical protein NP233_g2643 [Leucocoprinus birnbaumii]|uniref:Uncharacterized protein n=1 Tax=Leucocoprinus birnbaumii TaxID=56174 RepID=A0AAD5YYK9_9AGAR|nr:hypothetical protein NP233_g2643 [Leucocoprinus birnbaumii]